MSNIKPEDLIALGEALATGRITASSLHRFLERPWLVSDVYRGAKLLWEAPAGEHSFAVYSPDLGQVAWHYYDGEHRVVEIAPDGRKIPLGGFVRSLQFSPVGTKAGCVSGYPPKSEVWVDDAVISGQTNAEDIVMLSNGEFALKVITKSGREEFSIEWRGKTAGPFSGARLAVLGGQLLYLGNDKIYWEGKEIGPCQHWEWDKTDWESGAVVGPSGTKVLFNYNGLYLNGDLWLPRNLIDGVHDFGFLTDGTPYAVTGGSSPKIYMGADSDYINLHTLLSWLPKQNARVDKLAGRSRNDYVLVVSSPKESWITGIGEAGQKWIPGKRHKKITEVCVRGESPFSYAYLAEDNDGFRSFTIEDGKTKTVGPAYDHAAQLTALPSGDHIAFFASANQYGHKGFPVVDGAAGMLHQWVKAIKFISENVLRYVVVEEQEKGHIRNQSGWLRCYEVTLS